MTNDELRDMHQMAVGASSGGVVQPTDAQIEALRLADELERDKWFVSAVTMQCAADCLRALAVPQAPLQVDPVPVVASEPSRSTWAADPWSAGTPVCKHCGRVLSLHESQRYCPTPQAEPAVAEQAREAIAQVVAVHPPGPDGPEVNWLGKAPKPGTLLYLATPAVAEQAPVVASDLLNLEAVVDLVRRVANAGYGYGPKGSREEFDRAYAISPLQLLVVIRHVAATANPPAEQARPPVDRIMARIDAYAASYHVDAVSGMDGGTTKSHRDAIRAALALQPAAAEQTRGPLSMQAMSDLVAQAQIAFNLDKFSSFEVALIRKTEAALASQSTPPPAAPVASPEPVAWTLTETLKEAQTTTCGYLWFNNPRNSNWTPLYAAPIAPSPPTPPPESAGQPLTEEQIEKEYANYLAQDERRMTGPSAFRSIVRHIESVRGLAANPKANDE